MEIEIQLMEFVNSLEVSIKKLEEDTYSGNAISKLTINQFHYIDAIYELNRPTVSELAERLKITRASVTTGVNKLISMGYVHKEPSNEDRRVVYVRLTENGKRLIEAKYKALKEYGEFISSTLEPEELISFSFTLNKIVKAFLVD